MNIYLMRHAKTPLNEKGKVFCGRTDVSISETGIQDTTLIKNNELWKSVNHVYLTPLRRTKETAEILFGKNFHYTIIKEFAEMDFGDYEGEMLTQDSEKDSVLFNWTHPDASLTFPNGDNLGKHAREAFETLKELAKEDYKNILIVSHATTIRLILSLILTGDVRCFRKIPCDNGHITQLVADDQEIRVKSINISLK